MQTTIATTLNAAQSAEATLNATLDKAADQLDRVSTNDLAEVLARLAAAAHGVKVRLTQGRQEAVDVLLDLADFCGSFGEEVTTLPITDALVIPAQIVAQLTNPAPWPCVEDRVVSVTSNGFHAESTASPALLEVLPVEAAAVPQDSATTKTAHSLASQEIASQSSVPAEALAVPHLVVSTAANLPSKPAPAAPLTPADDEQVPAQCPRCFQESTVRQSDLGKANCGACLLEAVQIVPLVPCPTPTSEKKRGRTRKAK